MLTPSVALSSTCSSFPCLGPGLQGCCKSSKSPLPSQVLQVTSPFARLPSHVSHPKSSKARLPCPPSHLSPSRQRASPRFGRVRTHPSVHWTWDGRDDLREGLEILSLTEAKAPYIHFLCAGKCLKLSGATASATCDAPPTSAHRIACAGGTNARAPGSPPLSTAADFRSTAAALRAAAAPPCAAPVRAVHAAAAAVCPVGALGRIRPASAQTCQCLCVKSPPRATLAPDRGPARPSAARPPSGKSVTRLSTQNTRYIRWKCTALREICAVSPAFASSQVDSQRSADGMWGFVLFATFQEDSRRAEAPQWRRRARGRCMVGAWHVHSRCVAGARKVRGSSTAVAQQQHGGSKGRGASPDAAPSPGCARLLPCGSGTGCAQLVPCGSGTACAQLLPCGCGTDVVRTAAAMWLRYGVRTAAAIWFRYGVRQLLPSEYICCRRLLRGGQSRKSAGSADAVHCPDAVPSPDAVHCPDAVSSPDTAPCPDVAPS
eukprot:gene4852-biopygen14604